MHQDQSHMWTFGRRSWGFACASWGEVCWLKVPAHCGVPGNEDADTLANEGRLDSPLYLLPLAAGGVTGSSDEDEGVCQAPDMVKDYSILD